jgi:uncharacterized protein
MIWIMARALLLAALLVVASAGAQVAIPPPAQVTDLTGTLSRNQIAGLQARLTQFEKEKGSQIAVLIVPTTKPETIEQYALRVAESWKLGRKGVDDGALLLVAKNDRELRIEVGYGLEGPLPDAIAKRIISEVIVPRFREGDFYGGIEAGVSRMIAVIEGEPLPPPKRAERGSGMSGGLVEFLPIAFILIVVVGGVLRAIFGRLIAAGLVGAGTGLLAWIMIASGLVGLTVGVIAFFFMLASGGARRAYPRGGWTTGGWPSGGWSGGGTSGGWSGGGGGFGGGGASGRW